MGTVKVTITGKQGVGKSRFVREVLAPALQSAGLNFTVTDGQERGFEVGTKTGVKVAGYDVQVLVTNDPEDALRHIGERM